MSSMAGKECDLSASDRREHDSIARRSVRSVDFDLTHVGEKAIEARSTEDADLCAGRHLDAP